MFNIDIGRYLPRMADASSSEQLVYSSAMRGHSQVKHVGSGGGGGVR